MRQGLADVRRELRDKASPNPPRERPHAWSQILNSLLPILTLLVGLAPKSIVQVIRHVSARVDQLPPWQMRLVAVVVAAGLSVARHTRRRRSEVLQPLAARRRAPGQCEGSAAVRTEAARLSVS